MFVWLSVEYILTPTRPNSQARSSGVFPAESEMHGLDWCCSNISDCKIHTHRDISLRHLNFQAGDTHIIMHGSSGPRNRCTHLTKTHGETPTANTNTHSYPIVVSMLSWQVERDLSFIWLSVDWRASLQQHFHWLSLPLPCSIMQRTHSYTNTHRHKHAARPHNKTKTYKHMHTDIQKNENAEIHECMQIRN